MKMSGLGQWPHLLQIWLLPLIQAKNKAKNQSRGVKYFCVRLVSECLRPAENDAKMRATGGQ